MGVIKGEETENPSSAPTTHEIFETTASATPDGVALKFEDTSISYKELNDQSNILAQKIQGLTPNPRQNRDGDFIVAVCFEPSPDLISALLAVWKAGGAYVPIDPTFPEVHVTHILTDSMPALIITDDPARSALKSAAHKVGVPLFTFDGLKSEPAVVRHSVTQEVAIVLYTSGSSGIPKGVRLTHRNIHSRLLWQWRTFPFDSTEVCCFKTALTFVDSVAEIFAPILKSIAVVIIKKKDVQNPESLISILEEKQISRFILVPSLLRNILVILGKNSQRLKRIKLWVCSGETLTEDLVSRFFCCFPDGAVLANFYGSTEVMGDVTYEVMRSLKDAKNSIVEQKVPMGKVVHNCRVYLMDEDLNPVREGEIGEIYVGGTHVATGYVAGKGGDRFVMNPDVTDYAYATLYRTGDFARVVNGKIIYEGRKDSQVKVRGHRVDLSQIEKALVTLGQTKERIVLCYKPGEYEQDIIAFCSPINGFTEETTLEGLRQILPAYMLPKVTFINTFPRLVNGKVDRQSLLRHHEEQCARHRATFNSESLSLMVDGGEATLAAALIRTVTSVINDWSSRSLDLESNFFDIGGNSLNAILVVLKLQDQGFDIKISDFLGANKLRDILEQMQKSDCHVESNSEKQTRKDEISNKYTVEMMTLAHKAKVIHLISACFSTKGDLEIITGATYEDFTTLTEEMYDKVIAKGMSFVVKSTAGAIVGASFNTDLYDPVPLKPPNLRVSYVFNAIDFVESPVRNSLEMKGVIGHYLHGQMMGTRLDLTPAENVAVVQIMEQEVLNIARKMHFKGVLTTNTSSVTQRMCDDVFGYRVLADFEVRRYTAPDGSKPFENANEMQRINTTLKLF